MRSQTTASLVERLRELTDTGSDYAVAKLLGVTPQTLSSWKKGDSAMNAYAAAKTAELLGVDPMRIIAWLELEREPKHAKKQFWRKYAGRVLPAAVLALVAAGFAQMPLTFTGYEHQRPLNNLYIMRRFCAVRRRFCAPLAAGLGRLAAKLVDDFQLLKAQQLTA